ncbi:MAG: DUF2541 family protein [Planctomycetes bacterium]|nr:DUF2541 family protein [Planctomycetota bacterium]
MNRTYLVVLTLLVLSSSACGGRRRRTPPPPPPKAVSEESPADDDQGWERLGARKVNWAVDRDVIPVTVTEGTFKRIRLQVQDGAVHLMDLTVHFANGQTYDVQVRKLIGPGGRTRIIDLPGAARVIRKITLTYRTVAKAKRGKASVAVWGRQAG